MSAIATANDRKHTDEPVYWFVKLELALDEGDLQAAAECQRRLAALGVHILYTRQKQQNAEGVAHASR